MHCGVPKEKVKFWVKERSKAGADARTQRDLHTAAWCLAREERSFHVRAARWLAVMCVLSFVFSFFLS